MTTCSYLPPTFQIILATYEMTVEADPSEGYFAQL